MQAVQVVLQARLLLPQASQLAQQSSPAWANDAHCRSLLVLGSSQCFNGVRMFGRRACISVRYYGYSSRVANIVCMARERRLKMVSQQVRREISTMLLYDKVLQAAVLPETALGADMFLTAVATISDVEMSKDLSVAKVYISIYGDERGQAKALEGLKSKAGYVRKGLAQRMNLKVTPEVRFIKDDALERGSKVIALLDKLKKEREAKEGKVVDDMDEADDLEEDTGDNEEASDENDLNNGTRSWSTMDDAGDESDWDVDENITFIK